MAKIQYNIPIYLAPKQDSNKQLCRQVCKYAKMSESTSQCNGQKESTQGHHFGHQKVTKLEGTFLRNVLHNQVLIKMSLAHCL